MQSNRGMILIATLWIVGILSVLFMGIGFRFSVEMRQARFSLDSLKARYLGRAGIMKAVQQLGKNKKDYDTIYLCGIDPSQNESPESFFKNVKLGEGRFTVGYAGKEKGEFFYGAADEERKINVNTASPEILARLPEMTEEIVGAIEDWRDEDDTEGMKEGAEQGYYDFLPHPYPCRNAPFVTLEELWLVRGMTDKIYEAVKDHLTVYGDGHVNINTAPKPVLLALGMGEELADKLLAYRNGKDTKSGTADDVAFADAAAIEMPNLTLAENAQLASLKNSFKVQSAYFRIESEGILEPSGVKAKVVAVAEKKDEGSPRFVYYHEG